VLTVSVLHARRRYTLRRSDRPYEAVRAHRIASDASGQVPCIDGCVGGAQAPAPFTKELP